MLYFQVGGTAQPLRLLSAQELLAPGPTGLASASYSQLAAVIDTRSVINVNFPLRPYNDKAGVCPDDIPLADLALLHHLYPWENSPCSMISLYIA